MANKWLVKIYNEDRFFGSGYELVIIIEKLGYDKRVFIYGGFEVSCLFTVKYYVVLYLIRLHSANLKLLLYINLLQCKIKTECAITVKTISVSRIEDMEQELLFTFSRLLLKRIPTNKDTNFP